MKFTALYMKNFMRFKGENTIEFSTDPKYNVTVVLGDNTTGKTTLAQAFRWVLYGEVATTQYDKNVKDICILNNEVLGQMSANDHVDVSVELDLQTETVSGIITEYRIIRSADYIRKFPKIVAFKTNENVRMFVKDNNGKSLVYDTNNGRNARDKETVNDLISELLPHDLSSYFLFDGERWNDSKNTKNDIKDSVYSLVGVTPLKNMKLHLKGEGVYGRNNVIRTLNANMSGTGTEYQELLKKEKVNIEAIEKYQNDIKDHKENADQFNEKADEIQSLLDSNPNAESDQKESRRLDNSIKIHEKMKRQYYSEIVTAFSQRGNEYFAAPLLDTAIDLIKDVDLEGSDIPGVIDNTIYWILEHHKCICGRAVEKDSDAEMELNQLLKVVPPAEIGTYVGAFKDKVYKWNSESDDMRKSIEENADAWQSEYYDQLTDEEALDKVNARIDNRFNFADQRGKMSTYRNQAVKELQAVQIDKDRINTCNNELHNIESRKQDIEKQNKMNEKILRYKDYAERLYEIADSIYQRKVTNLLTDLNELIKKNFQEMFNEQEKYARLDDDYVLRLYYKRITSGGQTYSNMEATGLSEGEKIARNFAFIVSILELAKKMKAEDKAQDNDDDADIQSMPLVLDGPFSKLSTVNTSKVATVMPHAAEQVIIFLLDKDWEPSGLQQYTKDNYKYRIIKDADENSSVIKREGV